MTFNLKSRFGSVSFTRIAMCYNDEKDRSVEWVKNILWDLAMEARSFQNLRKWSCEEFYDYFEARCNNKLKKSLIRDTFESCAGHENTTEAYGEFCYVAQQSKLLLALFGNSEEIFQEYLALDEGDVEYDQIFI